MQRHPNCAVGGDQLEVGTFHLEDRPSHLEDRRDDLEDRRDDLEDRSGDLEDRTDDLEDRGDDLEDRSVQLEVDDHQLKDNHNDLEDRSTFRNFFNGLCLLVVNAFPDFLYHLLVESRQVIGFPAGHQAMVHYHFCIYPMGSCVHQVLF